MMSRTLLRNGMMVALFMVLGAAQASAQEPVRPQPQPVPPQPVPVAQPAQVQPGQPATQPQGTPIVYRAKQVLGSKVSISGNLGSGTVDDIVFDDAGNMDYLIVAREDGKLVTVPWEAVRFNANERTVVVNITADQYKTIPVYTAQSYPQFYTPTYRAETYKFYNLTPRELRRLDRGAPIRKP